MSGKRELGDHCSGCGLPLHPSTCPPSSGFSGSVSPERRSHLPSYLVHLIPGLSWIWWLTLASLFPGILGFLFLRATKSVSRILPLSIFQTFFTFGGLSSSFLVALAVCKAFEEGEEINSCIYVCAVFILLLAASLLLGFRKAGNSSVCGFVSIQRCRANPGQTADAGEGIWGSVRGSGGPILLKAASLSLSFTYSCSSCLLSTSYALALRR